MASVKRKLFGTYRKIRVEATSRAITKGLNVSLQHPPSDDSNMPIWLKLSQALAEALKEGKWGKREDEVLNWVREICSADSTILKGDLAVWYFARDFFKNKSIKRRILTAKEKADILKKFDKKVPIAHIARDYGVDRARVYRIIKDRDNAAKTS